MRWRIEDPGFEIIGQERINDEYAVYKISVHLVADETVPPGDDDSFLEQLDGAEVDEILAIEPIETGIDTNEET